MKQIYLVYPKQTGHIAPEIYGHFTEHIGSVFYGGLWVGKDSAIPNERGFRADILEKLRQIKVPVLRWPGGCFAETYDWRDGIGENRPVRVNWWRHLDGRTEPNLVGTHEFMDLCELTGAKAYFAANLTSMTPLHIRDWMDYCLSPRGSTTLALEREANGHPEPFEIPYWGVGNENWGGGGNMHPDFYANECRRYAELMHNVAPEAELYACGSNAMDYSWSHGVIPGLISERPAISGFSMHYYVGPKHHPCAFSDEQWDQVIADADKTEEILLRNWSILCAHGMEEQIKLVVDEWGCWYPDGSGPSKGANLFEEQSTMCDAVVAALTLNIFNRHCDKVRMSNVAQLVNCIHTLFLTQDEKCITTPTFHVFDLYQDHQGAEAIETVVTNNEVLADSVSVSASVKDGRTLLTLANLSCTDEAVVSLQSVGQALPPQGTLRLLCCDDLRACNTFEDPDRIVPTAQTIDLSQPIALPKGAVAAIQF